jgi:hypothetical protein
LKSLNSSCSVLLALCSRCPGVRFGERASGLVLALIVLTPLMICLGYADFTALWWFAWGTWLSVCGVLCCLLIGASLCIWWRDPVWCRARWGFATDWLFCWAFEFLNGLFNLFVLGTLIDCLGVRC